MPLWCIYFKIRKSFTTSIKLTYNFDYIICFFDFRSSKQKKRIKDQIHDIKNTVIIFFLMCF